MAELQRRGLSVGIAVWSDPQVNWAASGLCVLRSTWDYHGRYDEFVAWLERVTAATAMRNQARLVRWNAHKSYLRELQWCGVPVVPTEWVQRGEPRSLAEICAERGWGDAVLKPARGAAAHQVTHVRRDNVSLAAGNAALTELLQRHDALVQPYLGSVAGYGERGLIFFEDRYSHAVAKKPFDSVLAVGNARSSAITATSEEVEVASRAVAAVPGATLYARVDLLRDDAGDICVNELELIEPGLYLGARDDGAVVFADAVERELNELGGATTNDEWRSRACIG